MYNLSNIRPAKGSVKKKKIIGRGNSSGHGTYSCRGQKGQGSRSGVGGLKRLGMRSQLLQTPKLRGFKSKKPNNQVVNLSQIEVSYKATETVNPSSLAKKRLIADATAPVKILGDGELTIKDIKFEKVKISSSAKEKIQKVGGIIS
ncbi:MAG: 50S ribosomal protein L15 [Patescibacteria group bacterium]|nr:50S ribosomal protein L15 [Patescibacteria group bacterium]MDD4610503.1 50S ribosomal protein L15 [Patescibacteria group bacterium]